MFSLVLVWTLAIGMFLIPPLLAATFGSDAVSQWVGVYFAGAFGGLVLELTASRGQIELPSTRGPQSDPAKEEKVQLGNPLGRQVDLGFFSRMMLGGLAAFTVLLLAKFLSVGAKSDDFSTSAAAVSTLAWAVAIGFASPGAWAAVKRLAESRYKSALDVEKQRNDDQKKLARHAHGKLERGSNRMKASRANRSATLIEDELVQRVALEQDPDQIVQLLRPSDENVLEATQAIDEARGVLEALYSLGNGSSG
jgi:hypothetical protein